MSSYSSPYRFSLRKSTVSENKDAGEEEDNGNSNPS